MRESSTYQAMLEERRQESVAIGSAKLRRVILNLGERHLGSPNAVIVSRLEAESGLERLEELAERIPDVSSWDELLS